MWLEEHGDYLYRYSLLRIKNSHIAEELVQETLLAAVKGKDSFQGRSSIRTWLVSILKRKIIDHYRKSSREFAKSHEELDENVISNAFDEHGKWLEGPKSWGGTPHDLIHQKEFLAVLQNCLSHLPERLKNAFTLREMEDLPGEEICKILGVSSTNLWVILHRARQRLRDCIEINWLKR